MAEPSPFDLSITDELLATTRAVRKRLDFDRPVPREVIAECLELAVQAPTAGNQQHWRWIVVDDAAKRAALGELYRRNGAALLEKAAELAAERGEFQTERVYRSALWLAENIHRAPVLVIPCIEGRPPADAGNMRLAGVYGSIFPAVWSFQLALRARGLGSSLTTLHLMHEQEAAQLLGLPDDVLQVGMLPVAWTLGTDFKRAKRPPAETVTHWNGW